MGLIQKNLSHCSLFPACISKLKENQSLVGLARISLRCSNRAEGGVKGWKVEAIRTQPGAALLEWSRSGCLG